MASSWRTPTPSSGRPGLGARRRSRRTRGAEAPPPATLAIALGGAGGTAARALLSLALAPVATGWPWATLTANLLGALALGAVFGLADRAGAPAWLRGPGFTTGALGSFTTFSALAVEATGLGVAAGTAYAVASLAGGLAAAALGWRLGRGRP